MKIKFEADGIVDGVEEGKTILEIALENKIPHIHACGGKGKCSTCRVIVLSGMDRISARTKAEESISQKKGFEENIRLACQTKVFGDLRLRRLVIDSEDLESAVREKASSTGKDVPLAVLFSDIRGYTKFTEEALPYDTIHILNRYFKKMGDQVIKNHGFIDKYIGDGLMALFGLDSSRRECSVLDAVQAGLGMLSEMEGINSYLKAHFQVEFEIGIGIHYGNAIIGNMGHPGKVQYTAIGDVVNMAARVESINKKAGTNLLVTSSVYQKVKDISILGKTYITEVKGKQGSHILYEIKSLSLALSKEETLRSFLFQNIITTDSPAILRLAFHDAFLRNFSNKSRGMHGSIFQEQNLSQPLHFSLSSIATKIKYLHDRFQKEMKITVSISDFLAHSSCVGLEKTGGPYIECGYGRKDLPEEGGKIFPTEDQKIQSFIQFFGESGFSKKEMIVLMGAHSLGKAHGKYFTADPFSFSNAYYKRLLNPRSEGEDLILLDSDLELLKDEECKKWISYYANEEEIFFHDFRDVFKKLLNMGYSQISEKLE